MNDVVIDLSQAVETYLRPHLGRMTLRGGKVVAMQIHAAHWSSVAATLRAGAAHLELMKLTKEKEIAQAVAVGGGDGI